MVYRDIPRKPLLTAVFVIALIAPSLCLAAAVKGRIRDATGYFKGATVQAYTSYEDLVSGKTYTMSGLSNGNGEYELSLPEGEYYFVAEGRKENKSYYSYHGNNPVHIGSDPAWISFRLTEVKPPVYRKGTSSLTGRVTYQGQPVKKAWVSLYTMDHKTFKGSGFLTQPSGEDGTFSITWLPPGKYVLVARQVEGEAKLGPLKKGDLFCYYAKNPVEIKHGQTLQVELPCYSRKARRRLSQVDSATAISGFGIKGRVTDKKGNPVERVYVIADKGRMDNVSGTKQADSVEYLGITDTDGYYFISLDSNADLYIFASTRPVGRAVQTSILGIYGENPGKVVSFKKGQLLEGINIITAEQ